MVTNGDGMEGQKELLIVNDHQKTSPTQKRASSQRHQHGENAEKKKTHFRRKRRRHHKRDVGGFEPSLLASSLTWREEQEVGTDGRKERIGRTANRGVPPEPLRDSFIPSSWLLWQRTLRCPSSNEPLASFPSRNERQGRRLGGGGGEEGGVG